MKADFEVLSLSGIRPFKEVHALQLELLDQRIKDQISDTLIICEHTPTITRGRGLQFKQNQSNVEKQRPLPLTPVGTEYLEIERCGDLTWHGPGQLVIYPIVKLGGEGSIGKRIGHDVEKWIRFQEDLWISILKDFGISAQTQVDGSGVWIGDLKLASVGIALRRWVNYHGLAINIVNSLDGFRNFDPCGYSPEVMIRAKDLPEIPAQYFASDWRQVWERLFLEKLNETLSLK